MKTLPFIGALCMASALIATPAHAENWVMAVDDVDFAIEVDVDTIVARQDGLVAVRTREGGEVIHQLYDCKARLSFTTRTEAMGGIDYPDWRKSAKPVVPGSIGETALEFICARARR
jgi:hypothetical protein